MINNITELYKQEFIEAVINANKELYNYIHHNSELLEIEYSNSLGYGGDNSLNIDLYAEEHFIKKLKEFGNIYSEECGLKSFDKDFTIVIDPIDGSNNISSGLEYYGSSISLKYRDTILAGFVCNLATGNLIYKAFDDKIQQVSFLNKKIYKVQQQKLAIFERAYKYPNICQELSNNNIKYRTLGAVAISLANARNYLFVLFKGKIREFDISAALYICNDLYVYKSDNILLISKNKQFFDLVKEILKKY